MDITDYKPQLLEAHVNYDAEPVYRRFMLLHKKQSDGEPARTFVEVIWDQATNQSYLRFSTIYENKILMVLNHEEVDGWSAIWDAVRTQLINNEFLFMDKILYQSSDGYSLSLNSVSNPNNKKQQYIKLQKQSNISKLLFKPEQSVSLSENEITEFPASILKSLVKDMATLNEKGPTVLEEVDYKPWARQNPRKALPYYVPADVSAGGSGVTKEPEHPLFNTLKRQKLN